MSSRAEFSKRVRQLVAERAGFRCSFPGCDRTTVGPARDGEKSSRVGVAAHIYGAALSGKGPRGTGGLSEQELESQQNAIWLCPHHAHLIDRRGGREYAAEQLHSWKTLHEARIAHELTGLRTPIGWIDAVTVASSPLFRRCAPLNLGKLTFLLGSGGVGKTALCEWIAASVDAEYLKRWTLEHEEACRIEVELGYSHPERHSAGVRFLSGEGLSYTLDGEFSGVPVAPVKVVFPGEIDRLLGGDDLNTIAKAMKLHPHEVLALCREVEADGSDYVDRVWFEDTTGGSTLCAELGGRRRGPLLSHSEQARVLMELAILAGSKLGAFYPTLVILDSGFVRLDSGWVKRYAEFLGSPEREFQTIAVARLGSVDLRAAKWTGWRVVTLKGEPPGVVVQVGVREEAE